MRVLPPLNALPAFEATARLGSMVLAARELGRTHGAVSKQIRALSEAAGCALFERQGTGLKLTDEGAAFREHVAEALDQISAAYAELRRKSQSNDLLLGVSATFASRWLMPRLPQFHAKNPGVAIDFLMSGRAPDLTVADADLFITWDALRRLRGRPQNPDDVGLPAWRPAHAGVYEPVGDAAFGLVHAPGLRLPPATAQTLHVETRIVPDTLPNVWEVWATLSGLSVTAERDYQIPQTGLIVDSAANGAGVAVLEKRLIEEELQDERLVAPFGFHAVKDGFGVFVSEAAHGKPSVSAFIRWLKSAA